MARPNKWTDPVVLQEQIDKYFADCELTGKPYTVTGLCLALNCDMETIRDYREKDEFSASVKNAYLRCQEFAETHMFTARNPAGSIFALKNFGWTDKKELTVDANITQTIKPILLD